MISTPPVSTLECSQEARSIRLFLPEHPAHNLTEEIALFISNFEGFNEAPIKQIVEIIPTGKAALLGSQCCHDFMLLFQTLVYVNKKKMKTR